MFTSYEPPDTLGPVQAEREADRAPVVVDDQREALEPQALDEGGEDRRVDLGRVGDSLGPVGEPEPQQIRRNAAPAG